MLELKYTLDERESELKDKALLLQTVNQQVHDLEHQVVLLFLFVSTLECTVKFKTYYYNINITSINMLLLQALINIYDMCDNY